MGIGVAFYLLEARQPVVGHAERGGDAHHNGMPSASAHAGARVVVLRRLRRHLRHDRADPERRGDVVGTGPDEPRCDRAAKGWLWSGVSPSRLRPRTTRVVMLSATGAADRTDPYHGVMGAASVWSLSVGSPAGARPVTESRSATQLRPRRSRRRRGMPPDQRRGAGGRLCSATRPGVDPYRSGGASCPPLVRSSLPHPSLV